MPRAAKQKMMDGHDNIRFPGPGIDLIHHEVAVNLFQVVNNEEVLLETLNFNGRMLIERGKAYTNADGFRQVDFIALAWTATAWSKALKQDILYIRQARTTLDENFDKHITIPQLARQTGINEAKLKEGFRELFGQSIHSYLQQLRLEKAQQLLLTTEMSVTDITYDIGYSHVTHFTTLFRKVYGLTPGEWRKKNKG